MQCMPTAPATATRATTRATPRATRRVVDATELAEALVAPGSTLLAIWAHPDDETFLAGGLLGAAAHTGARVVNITATLGERGTDDPTRMTPGLLGCIRQAELDRALDLLGIEPARHLGFADGTLEYLPDGFGVSRIRRLIDALQPSTIVTFGHDGVTGHADHRTIARWVELATDHLADSVALVTTESAGAWSDDLVDHLRSANAFYPGYPDRSRSDDGCDVVVAGRCLARKLAAIDAHASQFGPLRRLAGETGLRRLAATEAYRPANREARRRLRTNTGSPSLVA
jgi:LmbE family N-acetylglucosaminyl deacetylase